MDKDLNAAPMLQTPAIVSTHAKLQLAAAVRGYITSTTAAQFAVALAEGEFQVLLQPTVRLADRRVIGFEALSRWQHPIFGQIAPDVFLQPLIDSGLAAQLTAYVLEQAILFQRVAKLKGKQGVPISVNATGTEFQTDTLVAKTKELLLKYSLPASLIAIEMTETQKIEDAIAVACNIEALRELGVSVYADDFGHAYASLRFLLDFSYTGLKIDRGFTAALIGDPNCEIILSNIATMAEGLGMDVTIEGIETEAQLSKLKAMGFRYGQGYLFDRPLSQDDAVLRLG